MRLSPLWVALPAIAFASPLDAQTVLVIEHNKKTTPVRAAHGSRPIVEDNGKRVTVDARHYGLIKVDEFLPVFIAVRSINVRGTYVAVTNTGDSINNQFEFSATFDSAFPLDDVFAVLELVFEDESKKIYLHEVGHLERGHPYRLAVVVPTGRPLGNGHYGLHLYCGGFEVLHSAQPFAAREAALDRLIAKRNRGRADGPPQPFVGPPPEFPEKLLKAKTHGHVALKLHVRSTGAVVDPTVVEASDPAFGSSAVESFRQWRFLPRIKDGRPVDTVVQIPLDFDPPAPPEKS